MSQITVPPNDGTISTHVGTTPSIGPFTVDFPLAKASDLVVSRLNDGDVSATVLVQGADYTIGSIVLDDAGFVASCSVTLTSAVSNCTVIRTRQTVAERLSNFPVTGFFSRVALNADLNRITMWMQDYSVVTVDEITNLPATVALWLKDPT